MNSFIILFLRKVDKNEALKLAEKEGLLYFEISAKSEDNMKKAFYSSIVELSFFEMYQDINKEKIIKELESENENNKDSNKNKDTLFKNETNENKINIIGEKPTKNSNKCKC